MCKKVALKLKKKPSKTSKQLFLNTTMDTATAATTLVAILLACSIPHSTSRTLYVVPTMYSNCTETGHPCHTLEHYEQNVREYFTSNTLMVFLNGIHTLESSDPISLYNVTNFTMIGSSNFTTGLQNLLESSSKINCTGTQFSGFYFKNASEIHIENLTFIGCGQRLAGTTNVRTAIAFDTAYNVTILRISARNSTGFGLHADRVFGTLTVKESIFQYNAGDEVYYGGNTRFWYSHCPENSSASVEIESSHFLNGNATYKHNFYPTATGITIITNCSFIYINITNVTVANNHADDGGNIAINIADFGSNHVRLSNSSVSGGVGHRGGGLRIWSQVIENGEPCGPNMTTTQTVLVTGTTFTGNHAEAGGGALYVSHYEIGHIQCSQKQIFFDNCTFINNTVPAKGSGAVMEIIRHKIPGLMTHVAPQFEISFQQCSFSNNYLIVDERNSFVGAIADIFAVELATFKDCNFTYNNNTALSAMNSNLVFEGNILFKGNNATNGGALKFCDTSVVYIRNNTTVKFISNHALKAGGAIYAQQRCLETATPCFFQPDVPAFTYVVNLTKMMQLIFINNTAGYAGSALYGGAVDYCYTYLQFKWYGRASYYDSGSIFNKAFNLDKQTGNTPISSDPYGVCLCNSSNLPDCDTLKNVTHKKYPGQEFNVTVVAVGQRNGVVPGIIEAILLKNKTNSSSNTATIPEKYSIQKAGYSCTTLSYAIESHAPQETINLTVQQPSTLGGSFYYEFHPPSITVLFLPCPWGFTLKDNPPSCECDPLLRENHIQCNIAQGSILRPTPTWIGRPYITNVHVSTIEPNENETQKNSFTEVLFHDHCPFDYCQPHDVSITANTTDKQCANNRTGILCGACSKGLSLALGSSNCLQCSNVHLLLVVYFALAGVLLVSFLTLCNLTVSEGTINALIFYANVIQINSAIFFPPLPNSTTLQILLYVPRAFIAWLNLDLGIQVCFYDGMDAYTKTWLQFAFPLYIWVIAGLIIYFNRKSPFIARLSGKHAVNVLATLFLLSYAKLQRTVITAFSATVVTSSEHYRIVWLPDGNIEYFHGKHIPLFLVAFFTGVFTLPYAIVLTFIQCLNRMPRLKVFCWVRKLKPLFDAYTGPYKERYCFWTGLLLLVRVVLFVTFSLNVLGAPDLNLMMTATACLTILMLAWALGGVYKKWPLDILESSYFLNLGVLSVGMNYVHHRGGSKTAVTYTSVTIALLVFTGTVIYHLYKQISNSLFLRNGIRHIKRKCQKLPTELEQPILHIHTDATREESNPTVTYGSVTYGSTEPETRETMVTVEHYRVPVKTRYNVDTYREPVLAYEDQ